LQTFTSFKPTDLFSFAAEIRQTHYKKSSVVCEQSLRIMYKILT